jgi:hypothetical protein
MRCGKSYKNQTSLSRHTHHECGKAPKFPCPFCKKLFKRKDRVKTHFKDCHPQMGSFEKFVNSHIYV